MFVAGPRLLRRTYCEGDRVKNETVGNLSHLPLEVIDVIRRMLAGEQVFSGGGLAIPRSVPHGPVIAVLGVMRQLGLAELLEHRSWERSLVVGLIAARLLEPGSKLATSRSWGQSTLASILDIENASVDELYAALDWLLAR